MALTRLANTNVTGTTTPVNTSGTTIDTTGASLLWAVGIHNSATAVQTLTDSEGNTWHPLTAYSVSGEWIQIFYAYDHGGSALVTSATHAATLSTNESGVYGLLFFGACSGSVTDSSVFVDENGANDSNMNTGAVTPSAAGDWVLACVKATPGWTCPTVVSGVTSFDAQTDNNEKSMGRVGATDAPNTSDITAIFTGSGGNSPCAIACFKAAGTSATPLTPTFLDTLNG